MQFAENVKEKVMRETENLQIPYVGYSVPENKDELELEILGLELAIKSAEQRIALLKQGLKVSLMKAQAIQNESKKNE